MKFEHAAESLRTGFYKVSQPSQFNDPFECRGNYTNFDEAVRRYVHKNFERLKFEAIRNKNSNTVAEHRGSRSQTNVFRYVDIPWAGWRVRPWRYLSPHGRQRPLGRLGLSRLASAGNRLVESRASVVGWPPRE